MPNRNKYPSLYMYAKDVAEVHQCFITVIQIIYEAISFYVLSRRELKRDSDNL